MCHTNHEQDYQNIIAKIDTPLATHKCELALRLITDAISVWQNRQAIEQFREYLAPCNPCIAKLESEIDIRHMLLHKTREQTPQNIRLHISETLGKIKLS